MTCDQALELLLDAEPLELAGRDMTPVGMHVRGCARCRRVAAQLLTDTELLAQARRANPVPLVRRRATPVLVPAFALAALVMAVTLRSAREEPRSAATTAVAPSVPVARSDPPQPSVVATIAPAVRTRPIVPVRAFAPAVALAPVRLATVGVNSPSIAPASNTVSVMPPEGTRATVMQTSNPKLVVVWLH